MWVLVVRQSYGAHSIGFWLNFLSRTKYLKQLHVLRFHASAEACAMALNISCIFDVKIDDCLKYRRFQEFSKSVAKNQMFWFLNYKYAEVSSKKFYLCMNFLSAPLRKSLRGGYSPPSEASGANMKRYSLVCRHHFLFFCCFFFYFPLFPLIVLANSKMLCNQNFFQDKIRIFLGI